MNKIFVTIGVLICVSSVVKCCWLSSETNREIACETLAEVTFEGNETWTNVNLYNEKIKFNLKRNSFRRTPNVVKLSLSFIQSVEKGIFKDLTKLDTLGFYSYYLEQFPDGFLDNLPIRTFNLRNGPLKEFLPGFFDHLPDLGILDLRDNNITEIKVGVFNNTPILKLYLDNNKISHIEPNAFANMDNIKDFSLTKNNLDSFKSEDILGWSETISNIWLDSNQLKSITVASFSSVPNLKKLNLYENQIEFIENRAFEKIPHLDFLDLSNNKITEISSQIFPPKGLPALEVLNIHNNRLTFLGKAIYLKFPKLGYISFGGNPFQCPCLDNIHKWNAERNISRICDEEYNAGSRPSCIFTKDFPKECINDLDLTRDLYNEYIDIVKDYPVLPRKCDTTKGAYNAVLTAITM